MPKKAPCLECRKAPVAKKFFPFCGMNCAAKHALGQYDEYSLLYCQEHGWVTWESTGPKMKPVCLFSHKDKHE